MQLRNGFLNGKRKDSVQTLGEINEYDATIITFVVGMQSNFWLSK